MPCVRMHSKAGKEIRMGKFFSYTRDVYAFFGLKRAAFFLVQEILHRKKFAKWFEFIETFLPGNIPDVLKTRLAMKPATRFVSRQFGVSGRIDALKSHYTMLANCFPSASLAAFTNGTQIAEITGKSGKKYIIQAVQTVVKEGTLSLKFFDPEAHATVPLAILVGVMCYDRDNHPVFMVGMLRGPGIGINGKQLVVDATRDLNGLRPKQALVHAGAAVAQWFGSKEILAPTSKNEIPIKNWFKGYRIKADHDAFWEEFAKEAAPDGNYHLSLPLSRRDASEVQQKRRKDWLLRYEKIDRMSADIRKTLDGLSEGKSA